MLSRPATPEPRGTKRHRPEDIVDEVQLGADLENASPNRATWSFSPKGTPEPQITVPRNTPPGAPQRLTDVQRSKAHIEATVACIEALRTFLKVCGSDQMHRSDPNMIGSRANELLCELNVCFPEQFTHNL
tara:strand:- start:3175 stop:3567 length:393 start_codon:yes stop_codon:yes gene_type:complete